MGYYYAIPRRDDELCHHGIKGQKWGIRRYQNPDGTLTEAGKARYRTAMSKYRPYSAAMAKKYNLPEEQPNGDQAWDNARYIRDAGGKDREIKRYLNENGLPANQWFKEHGHGKTLLDEAKSFAREKINSKKSVTEEPVDPETEKQMGIARGDAAIVSKYAHELTTAELRDAVARVDLQKRLSDLTAVKEPEKKNRLKEFTNLTNDVANAASAVKRLQDMFKPKEPEKDQEKEQDEAAYKKALRAKAVNVANAARDNTDGSVEDKEAAARRAYKQMMDADREARKYEPAYEAGKSFRETVDYWKGVGSKIKSANEKRMNKEYEFYSKVFNKPVSSAATSSKIVDFEDLLKNRDD